MKKLAIILSLILVLTACGMSEPEPVQNEGTYPMGQDTRLDIVEKMDLDAEEIAYLSSLQDKGVLKVASRQIETVLKEENGQRSGFNYNTIKLFTDAVGVDLEIVVVDNIEAFFRKDGTFDSTVKTDPNMVYSPDLFDDVDVYVDTLTQLPWREKLMDFIGFTPIRELVVNRSPLEITSVYELNGKTVAVQEVSSYMTTFAELERAYNIEFNYVYTDTILEAIEAVNSNQADLTIMDSNRAFLEAKHFANIEVGIPVTDVKYVGWAVSKDSEILKSILEKYMDVLIDEGLINELWLGDYEISFYEYYTLILKNASIFETMNLSAEELTYVEELRASGVLRAALQPNVVGYYFEDGQPAGFNYLLARDLAEVLGVDLDIVVVDQFTKYFWKDGETPEQIKTDENYFYVPDLFDQVDVYADNFTYLPWRSQILNQIKTVPVSTVIVQALGSNIEKMEDLDGKIVALNRDTSYEMVLENIVKTYNVDVEIYDVFSDAEGYDAIEKGYADFSIVDSDIAFLVLKQYENLEISLQASETAFIGWAVKKEDVIFASILEKYFMAMKSSGKFDAYWEQSYGVSYPEYMRLLAD